MAINFAGPSGALPQVPAWQVLEQPAGFWRGRTVLIGATAAELGDQQETPFGPQSGAEVQAAALASLALGTALRDPSEPLTGLLLLGWFLLQAAALCRGGNAAGRRKYNGSCCKNSNESLRESGRRRIAGGLHTHFTWPPATAAPAIRRAG